MIRSILVLTLAVLSSAPAIAADNGGFGASFNNKAPSALMEAPNSEIAQSVQTPSAEDLQNIMPAAGEDTGASLEQAVPTPDSIQSLDPAVETPKQ